MQLNDSRQTKNNREFLKNPDLKAVDGKNKGGANCKNVVTKK